MSELKNSNNRKYSPEIKENCFDLYCERVSLASIAERYKVAPDRLAQWSSLGRWKTKRAEIEALREAEAIKQAGLKVSTVAPAIAIDDDLSLAEAQELYETDAQAVALRIGRVIKGIPDPMLIAGAEKIDKLDKLARRALKLETDKPKTIINIGLLSGGRLRSALPGAVASAAPATEPLSLVEDAGSQPVTLDAEEV